VLPMLSPCKRVAIEFMQWKVGFNFCAASAAV
jgi:hypothetical protein